MSKIVLNDGKYTVINDLNEGGGFIALRYGEEWRNLAGDNLILAMYHEIEALQAQVDELKSLSLWAIRRTHKSYKEFAYNEFEKITGETPERL